MRETPPATGTRGGIGHTRWATHGRPSEINAHPHQASNIVVVHNGIIENYLKLKERLKASGGHTFKSETDTEIIAHLVEEHYRQCGDFEKAVRLALAEAEGAYAVAILCQDEPDKLIAAKQGGAPLVIGQGGKVSILSPLISRLCCLIPAK